MKKKFSDEMVELLQKKGELISRFEKLTNEALGGGYEVVAQIIADRGEVINEADEIQVKIDKLGESYHDEKSLREALINSCNRSELSEELKLIFDAAQQNFAIINRASKLNEELMVVLKMGGDEVRENLKLNTQIPKIVKFFQHSDKRILSERT